MCFHHIHQSPVLVTLLIKAQAYIILLHARITTLPPGANRPAEVLRPRWLIAANLAQPIWRARVGGWGRQAREHQAEKMVEV